MSFVELPLQRFSVRHGDTRLVCNSFLKKL